MPHTISQLIRDMSMITGRWHVGTRPGNDGEAGNTLEDLLGVPENNLKLPDYGSTELKTMKADGGSLVTLLHQEPKPRASVPKLLKCLGWKHREAGNRYDNTEMSFRSTTYGHRYSSRGFRIFLQGGMIEFIYDPDQVDRFVPDRTGIFATYGDWAADVELRHDPHYHDVLPVYYTVEDLTAAVAGKLDSTLLVQYREKGKKGHRSYKYGDAYLMSGVDFSAIAGLITDGKMVIDFDARTHHNHGTKLRIARQNLNRLFADLRLIPSS